MLTELSIKNFALIDDLNIRFAEGLTILSGETGAGKSLIINAVNLLLGSRASSRMIRTGAESAELEAMFAIEPNSSVGALMQNHDLCSEEGLLIRRVIAKNDRHKIYINGRMATIQMLSEIAENLASISGQHAHQGLLKEEQHLLILDQFGELVPLRQEVSSCYQALLPLIQKFKKLTRTSSEQKDQMALIAYQQKEILEAKIERAEDELLEQEKRILSHAKMLFETVNFALEELYAKPGAIVEKITDINKQLQKVSETDPSLTEKAEDVADVMYRIEDISEGLRRYLDTLQMDDKRLEEVENRLDHLNTLKRKYGGSLDTVQQYLEKITHQLDEEGDIEHEIEKTEKALSNLQQKFFGLAETLSKKRKEIAQVLSRRVEEELASLKMPQTRFEVSLHIIGPTAKADPLLIHKEGLVTEGGMDQVSFQIAPNVGEALKPLSKIASGGELSRVVLALKAILAERDSLETVVFDEVDSGIGGGVAEVVGKKLSSLAQYHQILCITHLAQIASFGDHHYKIEKQVAQGRTRTHIYPLDRNERIEELARMIGGIAITEKTLAHANEMLENNNPD